MNALVTIWTVIGLAILVLVSFYGGPIVAFPLLLAVIVVYLLVTRIGTRA